MPTGYGPFRFEADWFNDAPELSWVVTRWFRAALGPCLSEEASSSVTGRDFALVAILIFGWAGAHLQLNNAGGASAEACRARMSRIPNGEGPVHDSFSEFSREIVQEQGNGS